MIYLNFKVKNIDSIKWTLVKNEKKKMITER